MSRYLVLTKVMLKNFNLLSLKPDKSGKSQIKSILLSLLVLAAFLPLAAGIGSMTAIGYEIMSEIGQEGLILGIGFSTVSLAVFFFSIFYVMSIFYFSKDTESLLPLPLKAWEILAAKFTVTLVYEYLTELVLLAPIIVGFGIAGDLNVSYYLYGIIIFLTLPLLPLVYSSVLSMLVMRFAGLAKNKDRFRIIGGIIVMILAVGINAYITKLGSSSLSAEELTELLSQGNNSYVQAMAGVFFINRFAVNALIYSGAAKGFVNLLLFAAISLLFVLLFLSFGEGMYFKGAAGASESYARRKKLTEEELNKASSQKSALAAYTIKELKLLFRTPVYFMNCVLMNFLFPIFIILPFLVQPDEMKELYKLGAYVASGRGAAAALAAAFAVSTFVTAANGIASSAISREGSNIFVCKYLPISYKTQIMAKVLSGASMGAVGTIFMLLSAVIFIPIPASLIVLTSAASILGIFFSSFSGLLIDLSFPKLVWDSEQKAVKQNFNVVLSMLVSTVIAGIPIFVSIVLQFTLLATFLTVTVLFGILDLLLYSILKTAGVRKLERIEG